MFFLSASRRTDIPAFFSAWFFARLNGGEALVRNAFNSQQISRVILHPDTVAGIVFWTKNPAPMLARLDQLKNYAFYFQFTLNAYGRDVEPRLPSKSARLDTFKRLSEKIGRERVLWRYDPILLNAKYSPNFHRDNFHKLANALRDYTGQVTISFVDTHYREIKNHLERLQLLDFSSASQWELSRDFAAIATETGIKIAACAEKIDLADCGIARARCIDGELFVELRAAAGLPKIADRKISAKDKTQRKECGCAVSIDLGMFNSCRHGCRYCYANYQSDAIAKNCRAHDIHAPLLYGTVDKIADKITVHGKMKMSGGNLFENAD